MVAQLPFLHKKLLRASCQIYSITQTFLFYVSNNCSLKATQCNYCQNIFYHKNNKFITQCLQLLIQSVCIGQERQEQFGPSHVAGVTKLARVNNVNISTNLRCLRCLSINVDLTLIFTLYRISQTIFLDIQKIIVENNTLFLITIMNGSIIKLKKPRRRLNSKFELKYLSTTFTAKETM